MENPHAQERVMSDFQILKRSFQYIKPHRKRFIFAIFLMPIVVALELVGPYLSATVVNRLAHKDFIQYLSFLPLPLDI